jgi:hypothetical protein
MAIVPIATDIISIVAPPEIVTISSHPGGSVLFSHFVSWGVA